MDNNLTIGIIIPFCDEKVNIFNLMNSMPKCINKIIFIDKFNCNNRLELNYSVVNDSFIKLLRSDKLIKSNLNLSSSYIWARNNNIDIVIMISKYDQIDIRDLSEIINPIIYDNIDFCSCKKLFSDIEYSQIPKSFFWGNIILSYLIKICSGYWNIGFSQFNLLAINKKVLYIIKWEKLNLNYNLLYDLLFRINVFDLRVKEIITINKFKLCYYDCNTYLLYFIKTFTLFIRMFFWRLWAKYIIYDAHPLVLLFLLSISLFISSLILFFRLIIRFYIDGYIPPITASAILFFLIIGIQSFLFGLWMDRDRNKDSS
jgi:hypothetical protein